LRWKILQFSVFAGLTIMATGCGGFQGSYRVTPMTFLLPGFGKVETKPANPDVVPPLIEPDRELAQTENSHL
jgi:hypothetical protein